MDASKQRGTWGTLRLRCHNSGRKNRQWGNRSRSTQTFQNFSLVPQITRSTLLHAMGIPSDCVIPIIQSLLPMESSNFNSSWVDFPSLVPNRCVHAFVSVSPLRLLPPFQLFISLLVFYIIYLTIYVVVVVWRPWSWAPAKPDWGDCPREAKMVSSSKKLSNIYFCCFQWRRPCISPSGSTPGRVKLVYNMLSLLHEVKAGNLLFCWNVRPRDARS